MRIEFINLVGIISLKMEIVNHIRYRYKPVNDPINKYKSL